MKEKRNLNRAMKRLGEFGKLFMDYEGCPKGPKGRACLPVEQEVLQMQPVMDVDGDFWTPVNTGAINELVMKYSELKKTAERDIEPTCELVKRLEEREGVETIVSDAYEEVRFAIKGPAVVLIVRD